MLRAVNSLNPMSPSFFLRISFALFLCLGFARLTAGTSLPRSTPEEQGVSSAAILAFVVEAEQKIDALHSIMVVRHGHVIAEGWWAPYAAETPHQLFSLSKSFTSTAIGLLQADGKLSINDFVLPYFPEYAPAAPSDNLKWMRLRDLLIMSNGHETDAAVWNAKDKWAQVFLSHPVPHRPGIHFFYNSSGTYMLSVIAQKVSGETLLDYLRPRLFEPLGIDHPTWKTSPDGVCIGASDLNLRTEDIAKFGQLYLQKGQWQGRQLVPADWVEAATARQTSTGNDPDYDTHQGYGYQFWRSRHNSYQANGAFGQLCLILPDQDTVIAITSGLRGSHALMNLIWQHFLPAFQPAALPADPVAHEQLTAKLARLVLPTPIQASDAPDAHAAFAGQRYVFEPNEEAVESLSVAPAPDGSTTLHLRYHGKDQTIVCQPGTWQKAPFSYKTWPEEPYAVSGAWTAADTCTLKLCAYESVYIHTVRLKFSADEVRYEAEPNVDWGPVKVATLTGKLAASATP